MALENEYVFLCDDLPKRSFSYIGNNRTQFCDITFKVGELSIKAHRIILAAAIPYFHQVFSEEEVADSEKKEISFPDIDSDALEALIEYAYNCKIKISVENAKMLLSAASMLQMDEVKEACCRFLAERLNSENALDIRCLSSSLGCSGLVDEIDGFIKENFNEIVMTGKFSSMSFSLLKNFISSDELNVKNEEAVFDSALKWVKRNPDERREKLPELLKNIRLPLLEPRYIRNRVLKEELIRASSLCRDLVEEAMYLKLVPEEKNETCSFCITPRCNITKEILSICVLSEGCVMECFDLVKEKWETTMIQDVPSSIELSHSVVEVDKKMYSFNLDITHVIDLKTNRYSSCRGMKYPRRFIGTGSVAHKNKVFICGGYANGSASNIVECFDPKTEEWTELSQMNASRSDAGAAAYEEFIYVLGGFTNGLETNSVEKYNVETGMWSTSSPMLAERGSTSCCTLNDKIYVCGALRNYSTLSTAEVFDPITDEWKFIASVNAPRYNCKSVSCWNKIYLFGGINLFHDLFTFEIYDPEVDTWQHGVPTNGKKRIFGAAVVSLPPV